MEKERHLQKTACKDTTKDSDFVVVARVEAFIAGWGLEELQKELKLVEKLELMLFLCIVRNQILQKLKVLQSIGNKIPVVFIPT
jgi:phosphoenolpyruvate phosphomutase